MANPCNVVREAVSSLGHPWPRLTPQRRPRGTGCGWRPWGKRRTMFARGQGALLRWQRVGVQGWGMVEGNAVPDMHCCPTLQARHPRVRPGRTVFHLRIGGSGDPPPSGLLGLVAAFWQGQKSKQVGRRTNEAQRVQKDQRLGLCGCLCRWPRFWSDFLFKAVAPPVQDS